jgi:hypothetical protein
MGLDWIEYTGKSATYYAGDAGDRRRPLESAPAASGLYRSPTENYQDRRYSSELNKGPIQEGKFSIDLKPDPSRRATFNRDYGTLSPGKGIERVPSQGLAKNGEVVNLREMWGSWRALLEPKEGEPKPEKKPGEKPNPPRTNQYLHNSEKGSTHGCIEVAEKGAFLERLLGLRAKGVASIEVWVKYQGNSTNGITYGD